MKEILFDLLIVFYIYTLVKAYDTYHQVSNCRKKLEAFVESYEAKPLTNEPRKYYGKQLDSLLRYYPVIARYVTTPVLSYGDTDPEKRVVARELLNEFRMLANYKWHDLLIALNPWNTVKKMIALPVVILGEIGIKPKKTSANLVNLVVWVGAYFLDMFMPEIRSLVLTVFEHLINR